MDNIAAEQIGQQVGGFLVFVVIIIIGLAAWKWKKNRDKKVVSP